MAVDCPNLDYHPWPHRLAIVLACATFPLIWVGGLVTTYDAGMAVPDWPTTYGYNLFLYPWTTWLFGPFDLLIEHGHRLLGALVGMLAIGLVATVYVCDKRPAMRGAAVSALVLVLLQGLLGGVRVRLDDRTFAMLHACFGLATFAYLSAMAVVTSRYWNAARRQPEVSGDGGRLARFSWLTVGVIYMQVIVGAMLRHVPVGASPQFFRLAVLFHLVLAAAVLGHALWLLRVIWCDRSREPLLRRPAALMAGLVLLQISLGAGTWVLKYGWPAWFAQWSFTQSHTNLANSFLQGWITTAHVAVGALILSQAVVLSLRATRFFRAPAVTADTRPVAIGWTT